MPSAELPLVFGATAHLYNEARPGYPAELVDAVLGYAGFPDSAVEIGAGTGKATAAFANRGLALTCVEPDPAMAAVHSELFGGIVHTVVSRFEEWTPPSGGVPLLLSAMSWHWIDPSHRYSLAHAALRTGGTIAIFGHQYGFGDPAMEAALNVGYDEVAPELRGPSRGGAPPYAAELTATGLFADVRAEKFGRSIDYPTSRYLRLLQTFSPHLMFPADRRTALHTRLGEIIDARGGFVTLALDTTLVLARRTPMCGN